MGENPKEKNFEEGSSFVPKTIINILTKVSLISDISNKSSVLDFYLRSLEEEMKKVNAFKRELPFCMQLLKDGIERLEEKKSQCKEREMEKVTEAFVLPESNFERDERAKMSIDFGEKRDWMSSVRLWSTPIQYEHDFDTRNQESFISLKSWEIFRFRDEEAGSFFRGEGAFLPFKKTLGVSVTIKDNQRAVPVPVEDLSFDEPVDDVRVKESRGFVRARMQQPHQHQPQRKQRRCWSPELHRLFVDALDNLGGPEVATPKQIREEMKVEGLTNDEVKSHLQKYRIHIRRISSPLGSS
ncbi:hypothetical protein OROMI_029821 [Orobanche minor]